MDHLFLHIWLNVSVNVSASSSAHSCGAPSSMRKGIFLQPPIPFAVKLFLTMQSFNLIQWLWNSLTLSIPCCLVYMTSCNVASLAGTSLYLDTPRDVPSKLCREHTVMVYIPAVIRGSTKPHRCTKLSVKSVWSLSCLLVSPNAFPALCLTRFQKSSWGLDSMLEIPLAIPSCLFTTVLQSPGLLCQWVQTYLEIKGKVCHVLFDMILSLYQGEYGVVV